jgi:hypothetical protein
MKYMLMMSGTKADFDSYTKWSKKDLEANVAFMRAFSKDLKDSGVFVATEGLAFPDQAKLVRADEGWYSDHGRSLSGNQGVSRRVLDRRRREPGGSLHDRCSGFRGPRGWGKGRHHAYRGAASSEWRF